MEQGTSFYTGRFGIAALTITTITVIFFAFVFESIPTLPNRDYWGHFVFQILNEDHPDGIVSRLFSRSNEHVIAVSQGIYYVNYLVFKGTNKGLFVFNVLMVSIQYLAIAKSLRLFGIDPNYQEKSILLCLLFTPAAVFHWVSNMSGTTWFLADTFFWLSVLSVSSYVCTGKLMYLIFAIIASLLGSLSYSTGIPILFCVVAGYLVIAGQTGRRQRFFPLAMLFIFYGCFYYFVISNLTATPDLSLVKAIKFVFALAGNPFSAKPLTVVPSMIAGMILISTFCLLALRVFKIYGRAIPPAYLIPFSTFLYAAANVLLISYGRSGEFASTVSLTTRYGNIAMLLPVSIYLLTLIGSRSNTTQRVIGKWFARGLLGSVLVVALLKGGAEFAVYHYPSFKFEGAVVNCIKLGTQCTQQALHNNYFHLNPNRDELSRILKDTHHYPFSD